MLTSDEAIGTYTFNKQVIKHRFCRTCGIHPYGEGTDPNGNQMAAINLRCIERIDLESVPVQHFDGRSLYTCAPETPILRVKRVRISGCRREKYGSARVAEGDQL